MSFADRVSSFGLDDGSETERDYLMGGKYVPGLADEDFNWPIRVASGGAQKGASAVLSFSNLLTMTFGTLLLHACFSEATDPDHRLIADFGCGLATALCMNGLLGVVGYTRFQSSLNGPSPGSSILTFVHMFAIFLIVTTIGYLTCIFKFWEDLPGFGEEQLTLSEFAGVDRYWLCFLLVFSIVSQVFVVSGSLILAWPASQISLGTDSGVEGAMVPNGIFRMTLCFTAVWQMLFGVSIAVFGFLLAQENDSPEFQQWPQAWSIFGSVGAGVLLTLISVLALFATKETALNVVKYVGALATLVLIVCSVNNYDDAVPDQSKTETTDIFLFLSGYLGIASGIFECLAWVTISQWQRRLTELKPAREEITSREDLFV